MERRDNMLEYLLVILNSAAAIGVGPQPGELGKQYKVRQKSAGELPGKKGIKKGCVQGFIFLAWLFSQKPEVLL